MPWPLKIVKLAGLAVISEDGLGLKVSKFRLLGAFELVACPVLPVSPLMVT